MSFLEKAAAAAQQNVASGFYDSRPDAAIGRKKASFKNALNTFTFIAEIKPVSPSAGKLFDGDVAELARTYKKAGAGAISVLCEKDFFGGSPSNLALAKPAGLPVLAKDFVVSEKQLDCFAAFGADAVLLITELFERKKTEVGLARMVDAAHQKGLDVLLEFHEERLLDACVFSDADVVGVNNRNLDDLSMNPLHYQNTVDPLQAGKPVVAESGFSNKKDVQLARELGFAGVLIGTALLKQKNHAHALEELM